MPSRRHALAALLAAALAPGLARAQAAPKSVIVLFAGEPEDDEPATRPFFDEMKRLGWEEGRNVSYERVFGKGMRTYMEGLARTAASQQVDLIFATTGTLATAVLKATNTVPVVFSAATDPVASGLVKSLKTPGANATGAFQVTSDVVAQRLRLVKEAFPALKRIGVVYDREANNFEQQKAAHEAAAKRNGLELSVAEFTNYEAVAKHFANFRREGTNVVALAPSFTLLSRRRDVAAAAIRNELALVAHRIEWAEAGAVMSYGAQIEEALKRSAGIASRVLNGTKPGTIPVERVSNFEFALNRRTIEALSVHIPPALAKRATRSFD